MDINLDDFKFYISEFNRQKDVLTERCLNYKGDTSYYMIVFKAGFKILTATFDVKMQQFVKISDGNFTIILHT